MKYALVGLAGGLIGAIISGLPSYMELSRQDQVLRQQESELVTQKEHLDEVRRQADIMQQDLEKQEDRNQIQEAELQELRDQTEIMRQAVEKKSYIVMFVQPHTGFEWQDTISTVVQGGENDTASIIDVNSAPLIGTMRLHKGEVASVEIVLSNAGSSIANLYSYRFSVVPELGTDETQLKTMPQIRLETFLEPNYKPVFIPVSFEVTEDFAPKGKIYFEVLHDAGINKVVLDYVYVA